MFPDDDNDNDDDSVVRRTPTKRNRSDDAVSEVKTSHGHFPVGSKRRKAADSTSKFRNTTPGYTDEPFLDTTMDAAELVERADDMRESFYSLENPTCPSQVREMYITAANSGNPDAMVRLVEMNMKRAETVHADGIKFDASILRSNIWLKKLRRFQSETKYAREILILEADLVVNRKRPKKKEIEEAVRKYLEAYNLGDDGDNDAGDRGEGLYKLGEAIR